MNQQHINSCSPSIVCTLSGPRLRIPADHLRLMLLHATWETDDFLITTGEREHLGVQKLH